MAPTLPAELERSVVVDYVDDDETLRSCSLVCGRLCYWAQSCLFQSIIIGCDSSCDPLEQLWTRRVGRLAAILHASPHLASYIHSIHVQSCSPSVLAALASRDWHALTALELYDIPRGDEGGTLESLHRLVAAPVLHALTLSFASRAWSASYLRSLLVYCSPTLVDLRLMQCHEDSGVAFQCPTPNHGLERRQRPQISSLKLHRAMAAVPVLNDLDLTHLRNLDYHRSSHDSLSQFSRSVGCNVRSLKLNASDASANASRPPHILT
ncbi:hypothetical protein C8R45DRAFT_1106398 [Mycena sanguinolenta]|nr:hypothetical protein C8R45DRAFT_1106398 [Mycena sanguinolenta]